MGVQVVFLVFGGCTVAFSALCFLFLPDTPLNARFLTPEERAKAVIRVESNLTGIKSDEWKREQVVEALCDPNTWFLVLLQLSSNIPNNGIITVKGCPIPNVNMRRKAHRISPNSTLVSSSWVLVSQNKTLCSCPWSVQVVSCSSYSWRQSAALTFRTHAPTLWHSIWW